MTDEIFSGLSKALHAIFGDEYLIYPDEKIQELHPPCFLLSEVGVNKTPLLGNRSKKDRIYMIQYFPESETKAIQECRETAERIMNELDTIQAGGVLLRCSNMKYNVDREERVLNLKTNINTMTWLRQGQEVMEGLSMEMSVEKEE